MWQLLGEAVTLDGTDTITSDLLVPGTPSVTISGGGKFRFGGTIPGGGSAQPSGYPVALGGNASLRHLITRTNPIQLTTVGPPPAPAGTRDASLTQAGQGAGDFAAPRLLSLSGKAGAVGVPPGTYRRVSASGPGTAVVLGSPGSA